MLLMYHLKYRIVVETEHAVDGQVQMHVVKKNFCNLFDNLEESQAALFDLDTYAQEDFEECAHILARSAEKSVGTETNINELYDYICESESPSFEDAHVLFTDVPEVEPYKREVLQVRSEPIQVCVSSDSNWFYDYLNGYQYHVYRGLKGTLPFSTLDASEELTSPEDIIKDELIILDETMEEERHVFSCEKFRHWITCASSTHIRAVLQCLAQFDVTLEKCYTEYTFDLSQDDITFSPDAGNVHGFTDPRALRLSHAIHANQAMSWSDFFAYKDVRRAWTLLRASVKLLALHKRAAISANHPHRKRKRGEFDV